MRRALAWCLALGACSGAGGGEPETDPDGFEALLSSTWTLPPPDGPEPDVYRCIRYTPPDDLLISGFRSLSPPGTHHLLLGVGAPDAPDGDSECTFATLGPGLLYGAGVGTDDFLFPDGVALRVPAGQQLLLNLHLFNASDRTLEGSSGVAIRRASEEAVAEEAELVLAGTLRIDLEAASPPVEQSVVGGCRLTGAGTIFDWMPHMHRLGRHMQIEVGGQVVHDGDFSFEEQRHYPTRLEVPAGESIRVTCTYLNDTGAPVGFGEGTDDEMCFAAFIRYPARGEAFCVDE